MAYIGKSPQGSGVRTRYYYTATGGETSISGADDNGRTLTFTDGEYVDVYLNGILLVAGTDYGTGTANTISGLTALTASDIVEVVVYDIYSVAKINSEAIRYRYYKTASGGETSISGADDSGATITFPANAEIDVRVNGVSLVQGTDYNTTTANTVGGLTALTAGQVVEIVYFSSFLLSDTVSKASGGTFGGNVAVNGTLTATTLSGIGTQPNPSLIVNGAMQLWQRGTSFTTSGSGTFTADRWASNAGASTTFSRSTDVPTGFQYSISVAGSTYTGIRTRIEAANCKHIAGQEVTFSWYAKRTSGTGDMKTYLGYASAENDFSTVTLIEEVVNTASADVSSDWARYTYTVTLPSNVANGLHFVVFNGSASGSVTTLYTGIKLELGNTATSFIHEDIDTTIRKCQRFFCKSYNLEVAPQSNNGAGRYYFYLSPNATNGNKGTIVSFPVSMVKNPNVTIYREHDGAVNVFNNGATANVIVVGQGSFMAYATTTGQDLYAHWVADAEL